jgi:hypothetical protein
MSTLQRRLSGVIDAIASMLRYANWTRLATWSGKHDYRPEERGGSPVEKGAGFRMTYASVGGLFNFCGTSRGGL